jgi:hypothetical protein
MAGEPSPRAKGEAMHREERDFSIIVHVRAEFDDAYEGDDDGYAWHERFEETVKPRLIRATLEALRSDPAFRAVIAPRGRDPERCLEIDVNFRP